MIALGIFTSTAFAAKGDTQFISNPSSIARRGLFADALVVDAVTPNQSAGSRFQASTGLFARGFRIGTRALSTGESNTGDVSTPHAAGRLQFLSHRA